MLVGTVQGSGPKKFWPGFERKSGAGFGQFSFFAA